MSQKMSLEVLFQYRQSLSQMERDINSVMSRVNSLSGGTSTTNTQNASNATANYARNIGSVTTALQQSDNILARFTGTMTHNIAKMAEWGISGTLIFGSLRKLGEGIRFVTEMNTALANIRMATGMTTEETNGLSDAYNRLGKELGVSTKIIADSAVDLYRQGLNTEEVNGRLAEYIKLSKVIGENLQTTIELGTAATTAFGVGIKELGDIANTVGDATASSGREVMTAMQKSASVAQTAGVSMRELAAMSAVVASTTRESGSIVGGALKSTLSKLSQVDELTGDVNKDFGKTLKRLQDVGVAVTDSNGNLLSATQILKNVGSQWDTMSEKTQKYISSGFGVN